MPLVLNSQRKLSQLGRNITNTPRSTGGHRRDMHSTQHCPPATAQKRMPRFYVYLRMGSLVCRQRPISVLGGFLCFPQAFNGSHYIRQSDTSEIHWLSNRSAFPATQPTEWCCWQFYGALRRYLDLMLGPCLAQAIKKLTRQLLSYQNVEKLTIVRLSDRPSLVFVG